MFRDKNLLLKSLPATTNLHSKLKHFSSTSDTLLYEGSNTRVIVSYPIAKKAPGKSSIFSIKVGALVKIIGISSGILLRRIKTLLISNSGLSTFVRDNSKKPARFTFFSATSNKP